MAGLAIVAIPPEDDYIWRISSEKKPHLTLLFLGEETDATRINEIEKFLQHVVNTSMYRFGLSVDRRGTLGDKDADVLFFDKRGTEMLVRARSYLLTNPHILRAFNSTEQFPDWTPHLTLGYPETPAKEDKRDYPGTHWVNFDRIALWTGDFEGTEFRLKEQLFFDEEVGMSNSVSQFLAHYGIRGMKWGVRRSRSQIDSSSEDHRNATAARGKAKKGGVKSLSNKELQDLITRMNLEKQYSSVIPPSRGKRILTGGAKFTAEVLTGVGKQQATKLANDQASKLVAQMLRK